MFSDRLISGSVFLSLCCFRWRLASFIKLGNLVTTPEISKRSSSYRRYTPIKIYPLFPDKDRNMVSHPDTNLGQAASSLTDDSSPVGHPSMCDRVVGRIWQRVPCLLTMGLVLPRRNMGWRWGAFKRICRSEGRRRKRLPEWLMESKGCLIKGRVYFLGREGLWKRRSHSGWGWSIRNGTVACVHICITCCTVLLFVSNRSIHSQKNMDSWRSSNVWVCLVYVSWRCTLWLTERELHLCWYFLPM